MQLQRILLADDSQAVHKAISIALAAYKVSIEVVTSYTQAVHHLKHAAQKPDLIIADISLAGVTDPLHFVDLIGKAGAAQLLVLIGSYDSVDLERYRQEGISHQLKKPFESGLLIKTIKTELGFELKNSKGPQTKAAQPKTQRQPTPQKDYSELVKGATAGSSFLPQANEPSFKLPVKELIQRHLKTPSQFGGDHPLAEQEQLLNDFLGSLESQLPEIIATYIEHNFKNLFSKAVEELAQNKFDHFIKDVLRQEINRLADERTHQVVDKI